MNKLREYALIMIDYEFLKRFKKRYENFIINS